MGSEEREEMEGRNAQGIQTKRSTNDKRTLEPDGGNVLCSVSRNTVLKARMAFS